MRDNFQDIGFEFFENLGKHTGQMMKITKNTRSGIGNWLAGGLAVFAFACLVPGNAPAGEEVETVSKNPVPGESPWESSLRLDGWIVDMNIGLEQTTLGLSKSVFIGFDDIITNLDWIVPIGADVRYQQFGFMPDLVAMKISGGQTAPGPFYDRANYEMKMGILNLPFYYRFIDQPKTSMDVLGGARFLWADLNVGLKGGPLGSARGSVSAGTDVTIWDGIVGLRLEHYFTDKLFCSIYGDVGTGNSDLTWQILASVGYRLTEHLSVSTGYRYLDYELSDDNANIDLDAKGIQVSLDWDF